MMNEEIQVCQRKGSVYISAEKAIYRAGFDESLLSAEFQTELPVIKFYLICY